MKDRIKQTKQFVQDHKRGFMNAGFFIGGVAATFYCVDLSPRLPKHIEIYAEQTPSEIMAALNGGKNFARWTNKDQIVDLYTSLEPSITDRHPL